MHVVRCCGGRVYVSGVYFGLLKVLMKCWVDLKLGLLGSLFVIVWGFSALCTALPNGLVGGGLVDLVERACRGTVLALHVATEVCFRISAAEGSRAWSCWDVCDALTFLDGILYDLPLGCVRRLWRFRWSTIKLVADLFLFCCERAFVMSLSDDGQADVVEAFGFAYGYLDDT